MGWFHALTLGGWIGVVSTARILRSGPFVIFVAVLVGIYSLLAVALAPSFAAILPVFAALHVAAIGIFQSLTTRDEIGLGRDGALGDGAEARNGHEGPEVLTGDFLTMDTGHYGFPLRLGVPAEESVLLIHRRAEG